MKRLVFFLVFSGALAAFAVATAAHQQPEKGEPFTGAEVKGTEAIFTRRFVKVRNGSEEKLTGFLQYRTLNEDNAWIWLPGEAGTDEAVTFEIEPGQEVMVEVDSKPITASRIRLWATGQTLQFSTNKTEDIWTVPEVDADEHRYKAMEMDTFTYVLAPPAPTGPTEIVDDTLPPPPAPGDVVTPQPNIAVVSPLPPLIAPDLQPAPLIPVIEPAPVVVIPLPPFIPLPVPAVPFPMDADLTAAVFKIDETGVFAGTILNAGPAGFPGGRQWFVLKSTAGPAKFGSVVAQGFINPLLPNATQDIAGTIGPVTIASRYILVLSPGDSNRLNDFSQVVFLQSVTAKSDLAAKLALNGKKLVGTITNNGPEPFKGDGKRTFQIGDKSGLVAPLTDKVGPLAVGASTNVTLDVTAAVNAKTHFFLALNHGDDVKVNDTAVIKHDPKGKGIAVPDLEAKTLVIKGKKLVGTIINHGPGNYLGGRSFFLGNSAANKSGSVGPLNVGASQTVELTLSDAVLATNQTFKLHVSGDDDKPGNDNVTVKHNSKAPDLGANLTITGHKVKGIITNHGAGNYDGVSRTFTLSAPALGKTYQSGPIGKLKEKETFVVNFTLPAGAPTQSVVLSLNNGDSKPVNDIATQNFSPDEPDLKVSLKITGTNAHVTIANIGATPYPAAGKRTFTIERPGLKSFTAPIPGPISKGASKSDNFSLVGATPGGKVTVSLSPGDSNKSNDTAFGTFTAFDLVIGAVTIKGTTFSIPLTNKGPAYNAGDSYVITGPGKFKETGKIPNIPAGGNATITHAAKAKLETGMFTVTLNVKDLDVANNKKDVLHKTTIELAIGVVTIKGTTFSIPVANKGPDYGGGDSFTITGPGGFKETGKIPKIGAGGNVTLTHAAKAKLGDGIFTVTLNIKDSNPANNTAVVKHKTVVPSPSLAIVSITRDGKMVKITLKNEGTGDYATGGGVVFKLVHQLPKGATKNLPEPAIPNIAAGATVSFQVPDPGVGALTGTFTGTASAISNDPNKNKKTVK